MVNGRAKELCDESRITANRRIARMVGGTGGAGWICPAIGDSVVSVNPLQKGEFHRGASRCAGAAQFILEETRGASFLVDAEFAEEFRRKSPRFLRAPRGILLVFCSRVRYD